MPLSDQKAANHSMEGEKPKATFMSAVAISPPASSRRGEVRDPSTPDANLETPYMMGKMEVRVPICGGGEEGRGRVL
jgi:hypothetical protein